jgi:iron(III) transport system permease protein
MARVDALAAKRVALPRWSWSGGAQWLLLGATALLVLAPIVMVMLGGFNVAAPTEGFRFGLDNWRRAWSDPTIWRALGNSVLILVTRGILGFLIAIPLAWLVARTNLPGARWLEFGFWVAFFMPSLAAIQGWIFLLEGRSGLLNQWLRLLPVALPAIDVYSFWGIIWVHLMSQNVSALFVLLVLGFRNMDASLEEAAHVCGASRLRTVAQITLPLTRPMMAMLVILAIIRGLQSYEIEQVLGQPVGIDVYSTLVVKMLASEPPRIPEGTALSTFVLLCLVPLIFLQRWYVGRRQYTTITGKMRAGPVDLGRLRWPAWALVTGLVLLMTLVPLASVVAGSLMRRWGYFGIPSPWTLSHWQRVFGDSTFVSSLLNTLLLGLLAGIVSALVVFVIAYVLVRTSFPARGTLDFVSWLPWAIPGVLLSLGLVAMVLLIPPLRILYGTLPLLVVAVLLFRFPLGVHFVKSGLMQVSKELEEASTVCGTGWLATQRRITLPILMPMLVAVGLMTFVTAVNEVSGVVLLASTDTRTLSLLSLGYLTGSFSEKESAAVVTTIMVLLCVGVALVARQIEARVGNQGPGTLGR